MPNRVIRDGLLDSEKILKLSAEEERFYVRLLLIVDDYGRFEARSVYLKSKCFPVNEKIKSEHVKKWLKKLLDEKLILIYSVEGKDYLEIVEFNQRLRQKKEKYPGPELADDSNVLTLDRHTSRTLSESNPIRKETETEKKPKQNPENEIKEIYAAYPSRCPIKNSSTGKYSKNKDQILNLLKSVSFDEIIEIQKLYVKDCTENKTYMKNYSTFLNNFPSKDSFSKTELEDEYKDFKRAY